MNGSEAAEKTDVSKLADEWIRAAAEFEKNIKGAYIAGYIKGRRDAAWRCGAKARDAADELITEINAWECELSGLRDEARKFKEKIKEWETN